MKTPDLPLQQLFVLLFRMPGPLKAVPTFDALTVTPTPAQRGAVTRKAVFSAAIALTPAILAGHL